MKQIVKGRLYAFSDLHGNYNLFKQIQNYIKPEDKVFCLGDIGDRGSDGIKIMQEIFKDDRFFCLMGNHEAMLIDIIEKCMIDEYFKIEELDRWDMETIRHNGTLPTLKAFVKMSNEEQVELFQKLNQLPSLGRHITEDGKEIWLCHAGTNPDIIWETKSKSDEKLLYWDRKHITLEHWDTVNYPNMYVIHGHTPVQTLGYYNKEYQKKPIMYTVQTYCDGHKIDIDVASFTTKKIALIDIETFEVKYFKDNADELLTD